MNHNYEWEGMSPKRFQWEDLSENSYNWEDWTCLRLHRPLKQRGVTIVELQWCFGFQNLKKNRGKPFWKCLTSYVSFNLKNMYVGEKTPMSNSDVIIFHIWCLQLGSHQLQWIRMGWCNLRWSRTSRWHVWC